MKTNDQKFLVSKDELMLGKKGAFWRAMAGVLMKTLSVNKANRLYSDNFYSDSFTSDLLADLDITYTIDPADLENIPPEGPVVIICNHPTGALDGIMLIDAISKVRPDVKFMGNYLLNRIEPLRKNIIAVDPFDTKTRSTNMRGIKESLAHLVEGKALALFPAGEVATWQRGLREVKDKEWEKPALRFIRRAGVPVMPVCIEARNSRLFRLVGKIDPRLRTAMLPRELFNKRGQHITALIGAPIAPEKLASLDEETYDSYLRAMVEYLYGSRELSEKQKRLVLRRRKKEIDLRNIMPELPKEKLQAELQAIRDEHMLLESGDQSLYCAPADKIPNVLLEIGRMREITFREIGEGTNNEVDTDIYDSYYYHLFLWDHTACKLVGAYRMGFGDEIIPRYGLKGFYTNSLFRYSEQMAPLLQKTIELGRSFIAKEYQRKPASLMLLWKGILYVLLRHEQFRYLMGPVTVSGELHSSSKMIIATHLRQHYMNEELARYVRPVTGLKGIKASIDPALIENVTSIELINKIILDIERDSRSIPVLVKKYISLSSSVLGFNIDHDFCDAMDALMLLDLKNTPEKTIMMLSKEIKNIDVIERFKNLN